MKNPGNNLSLADLKEELSRINKCGDDYERLGVDQLADRWTVRQTFVAVSRLYHPDLHNAKNKEFQELTEEIFMLLSEAERRLRRAAEPGVPRKSRARTQARTQTQSQSQSRAQTQSQSQSRAQTQSQSQSRAQTQSQSQSRAQTQSQSQPLSDEPVKRPPSKQIKRTPSSELGVSVRPPTQNEARRESSRSPTAGSSGVPPALLRRMGIDAKASITSKPDNPSLPAAAKATPDSRYDQALKAISGGKYQRATEFLLALIAEFPETMRFQASLELVRGHQARASGQTLEALEFFHRVCVLDGGCVDAIQAIQALTTQAANDEERLLDSLLGDGR